MKKKKKKYRASFEVEGEWIGDDIPLTKDSMKNAILVEFNNYGSGPPDYCGGDCKVRRVKVEVLK